MFTSHGPGLDQFADEFAASLREFATGFLAEIPPATDENRRSEGCAALWAATQSVFDASILSPTERKELLREITRRLLPFWQAQCASRGDASQMLAYQSEYGPAGYGRSHSPGNLVRTAESIVSELLRTVGSSDDMGVTRVKLSTALVQRMYADLRRIDDYKKQRERRRPARPVGRPMPARG